jgi:hypothetical protein
MRSIALAEVKRDLCGFWEHPVLNEFPEEATFKDLKEKYDVDITYSNFEYDAPDELCDEYFESGNPEVVAKWEPTPPSGGVSDWHILSIHCTEDGDIYCTWYKNLVEGVWV